MQFVYKSAVFCTVILTGCGYIGEPQYPALYIPNPVADLAVIERGDRLSVQFTIPALTTEGLAVKSIGGIDLRVGPSSGTPFNLDRWAEKATRMDVQAPESPSLVQTSIPVNALIGQDVIVAVRIANGRGRFSQWSNLVNLQVQPPLPSPAGLVAENTLNGVDLRWKDTGTQFRIFRRGAQDKEPAQIATSQKPEYIDSTATYGQTYDYYVQAVRDNAESETAGPVRMTPKDVFPPAVPSGLNASAGLNAIELAWDRNNESDLRGYNVYRSNGTGSFMMIAGPLEAPNYSDKMVQSGTTYRYAVTSIDQNGNESQKSQTVEAVAP
jgi:hypothetical protein